MNKNGQAKLGDFNVSKIAKPGFLRTQTGTPYYTSPEVWRDESYDTKSDIWSIGCVFYEVMALLPPFRARDMDGLFKKVTTGAYEVPPSLFSSELTLLIHNLLKINPKDRPSCT